MLVIDLKVGADKIAIVRKRAIPDERSRIDAVNVAQNLRDLVELIDRNPRGFSCLLYTSRCV